ncbi:MAG TPA: hypothetical protein VJJ48_00695 [Candidatus Paceibacterota bacterium]
MANKLKKTKLLLNPPRILTEYEIGRSMGAIEAIELLDKPIAEVMTRRAKLRDLEADLEDCIKLSGTRGIKYYVRRASDGRYEYGFYRYPWVLAGLDFLQRTKLSDLDRSWISGRLFGYTPREIQRFIDRDVKKR